MPNIFDYDRVKTADYKRDFWDEKRSYEDLVERLTLKKYIHKECRWFIDLGAGFGRLSDLYLKNNQRVVLFDYSESLLRQAQGNLAAQGAGNAYFVLGDVYRLPFKDNTFEGGIMLRVMHHLENARMALGEIARVFAAQSVFVLEYPNKRNLLEILRFLLGRSRTAPFRKAPARRGDLYYNYHPRHIQEILDKTGWQVLSERGVSIFRTDLLKRIIDFRILAKLDLRLQGLMGKIKLSPSIFLQLKNNKKVKEISPRDSLLSILCCPLCRTELSVQENMLKCSGCSQSYGLRDGIYDLRAPSHE